MGGVILFMVVLMMSVDIIQCWREGFGGWVCGRTADGVNET